ncbi:MAG: putative molybdenum carrier protein [Burkholderiales bacterium]
MSGGQTGADQAALNWAIKHGFPHGGWCPAGKLAEDGKIADSYQLSETPSSDYAVRTEWNVRDSDATLIFSLAPQLTGGSKLTQEFCIRYRKPCLHIHPELDAVRLAREFLKRNPVKVLNIAGSRISREPGIVEFVRVTLDGVFSDIT